MKGAVRLTRFAFISSLGVIFTILILRGRDPSFASFLVQSRAEKALGRVIENVEMHQMPFCQAIEQISRMAGVEVELPDRVNSSPAYYCKIDFRARRVTLADALRTIIRCSKEDELVFVPDGDRVRIVLGYFPEKIGQYLLPDYIAGRKSQGPAISTPLFSANDYDETNQAVASLAPPDNVFDSSEALLSPPHLFVLQSAPRHQRLRKALAALAPGAAPTALCALPRGTCVLDLVDGQFRARQLLTGNPTLDRLLPSVRIPEQPFHEALALLGEAAGTKIILGPGMDARDLKCEVALNENRITVGLAIRQLLSHADLILTDIRADRPAIRIVPARASSLVRIYDLRSGLAQLNEKDRARETDVLIDDLVSSSSGWNGRICFFGSLLVVDAPWRFQEQAAERIVTFANDLALHRSLDTR